MPLSNKQMEYLAIAWQCFDAEPKIDYEKFKDLAGLKSAASARELMRVAKNKLKEEYGALGGTAGPGGAKGTPVKSGGVSKMTTGSASASTGKKRGRPAGKKAKAEMEGHMPDEDDEGDSGEGEEVSPLKKKKKKLGTSDVKLEKGDEEESDGEFL